MSIDDQLTKLTDTYESIGILFIISERFKAQLTPTEQTAIDVTVEILHDVADELWAEIKRRATWPPSFSFGSMCKKPEER